MGEEKISEALSKVLDAQEKALNDELMKLAARTRQVKADLKAIGRARRGR